MNDAGRAGTTDSEVPIHRIEFAVDWPPGHAAAYVLATDEPVLIDAGTPGERGTEELKAGLADAGYTPADIEHVVLTHGHTDHVGQTLTLCEAGSPTIYAPKQQRARYQRDMETVAERTRANLLEAGLEPDLLESASERLLAGHRMVRDSLPEAAVDRWIDDEPFSVGEHDLDPIYTPGHHISHVCFGTALDGARIIFSGDMAIQPFRAPSLLVNFDDGATESVRQFRSSLDHLATHQFDRVYPGHGPVHDRYLACLDRSRSDLEGKCEYCLKQIESGNTTAFQIAVARTGTKREISRIIVETVGCLGYLEHHGRVQHVLEDGVRYYERV